MGLWVDASYWGTWKRKELAPSCSNKLSKNRGKASASAAMLAMSRFGVAGRSPRSLAAPSNSHFRSREAPCGFKRLIELHAGPS